MRTFENHHMRKLLGLLVRCEQPCEILCEEPCGEPCEKKHGAQGPLFEICEKFMGPLTAKQSLKGLVKSQVGNLEKAVTNL